MEGRRMSGAAGGEARQTPLLVRGCSGEHKHARGWTRALILKPWPGDNGVTRGEASAEQQKE